jgi:hypothetical protein
MASITCHEATTFIVTPGNYWNLMTFVSSRDSNIRNYARETLKSNGLRHMSRDSNLHSHPCMNLRYERMKILKQLLQSSIKHINFYKPSSQFQTIKCHAILKHTIFSSLIKKLFELSLTNMFITFFTTIRHWTQPSVSSIHSVPSYPISLRFTCPSVRLYTLRCSHTNGLFIECILFIWAIHSRCVINNHKYNNVSVYRLTQLIMFYNYCFIVLQATIGAQ